MFANTSIIKLIVASFWSNCYITISYQDYATRGKLCGANTFYQPSSSSRSSEQASRLAGNFSSCFWNLCSLQSDFLPENFYSYKLENGLELYVQEDFTIPALKVEYVTKAGTARQQKDTAGFFRLYSALFWQNAVPGIRAYEREGANGSQ